MSPPVNLVIESLCTFCAQGALSAQAEVYLSCLMCLEEFMWLLCRGCIVLSYHGFIWHQMSNNGTSVEMPQLLVHHCCAEVRHMRWSHPDTWIQIQIQCLLCFSYCRELNVPVTYCTQPECWQTVGNVGGQLVSAGPAICLHLPRHLQHMSGSLNVAQWPHTFPLSACWPADWENEGWGGRSVCLSVAWWPRGAFSHSRCVSLYFSALCLATLSAY